MGTEGIADVARRQVPWLRVANAACGALTVASLLAAGGYGVRWHRAANDQDQAAAVLRDEVLADARQVILNLEAVSYETLDADLTRWESSITGRLLDEFRADRPRYAERIGTARSTVRPRIVEAAVIRVDAPAGRATVLLFVDVTVTERRAGSHVGPATRRQCIRLELTRTGQGWKAAAAGPVSPVETTREETTSATERPGTGQPAAPPTTSPRVRPPQGGHAVRPAEPGSRNGPSASRPVRRP